MELNSAQSEALDAVLSGHNLLLLGAAGTGKTSLLKHIVRELSSNGLCVALTATTGIACCLHEHATTIHRWSGIGDGRYDVSEIQSVVESNVQFAEVRKRVAETDVLIVDECSMLSKRLFESLNEVCKLKNKDIPFGGIQLILSGDFTQLPPVPNMLYGEEGEFCFQSCLFDNVLPHRVTLTEVMRQTDHTLIKAIHEVAYGTVTKETELFIKDLRRPLPCDTDSMKLFARNEQVDEYNRNSILSYPGQLYEFQCEDEGDQKHLNKILAPKILWLKIGAPVILLRNLSDKLVNGLRGHVHDINDKGPIVDFPSLKVKVPLEKLKFTVFSPSRNTDVAVREQYPIKLGFAISIHKSQGLTMDRLEIDCRQIFKPGQLGVALGRATSTEGLRVINFNPKLSVIPQPDSVLNFLRQTSSEFTEDRSCCKQQSPTRSKEHENISTGFFTVGDLIANDEAGEYYEQENDEFDSEFDELIKSLDETQSETVDLPSDLDLKAILSSLRCTIVKTPMQYTTNKIVDEMSEVRYTLFCKNEYDKLSTFIDELRVDPSKPVQSKFQTEFYSKTHMYQTSAEFRINCLKLFENIQFTEDHLHICFNISNQIRTFLLKTKAELFPIANRKITERTVTNASEARVRYVGGYAVAKVRHKCMQKEKRYMYKVDASSQALYEDSKLAVSVLDSMKVEEFHILHTSEKPESLLDIKRKQRQNRSLTNIPDNLFQFFKALTENCLNLLVDENMNKYGSNLFEVLRATLMGKTDLYKGFVNVVEHCTVATEDIDNSSVSKESKDKVIKTIYSKIIKLFLMVMVNQFRKDVLEAFDIQKKMAHRKQVRVSGKKASKEKKTVKSGICAINQSCSKETVKTGKLKEMSPTKEMVRSNVQSGVEQTGSDSQFPPGIESNKGKRASTRKRKAILYDNDDASSVDSQESIGRSGKLEDNEACVVCHLNPQQAPLQIQWIMCDSCNGWHHRKCAGLQQPPKWKMLQRKGAIYLCKQCK